MAPTCASWIFMALRYTMRRTSVVGNVCRADVEHANITAQCMSPPQLKCNDFLTNVIDSISK